VDPLREELENYCRQKMLSFHTPGHKGRAECLSGVVFPDYDLTELPGLDALHNPCGVIAEAQKKAAAIYGADETFFLVNGSTAGNQAMFFALMPELEGKKIRIERKAHRSVIGALILSGAEPDYIAPVIHPEFNLPLGLDSRIYCSSPQQVGAFHLTSPSYWGTVIDLPSIIEWRDNNAPLVPILVDQAHGAHFRGNCFPPGAVALGADLVVHSTHKTLAALTQAAMLHVQGNRISRVNLRKSLELLQSSSPSYLLLESLANAMEQFVSHSWESLYEEVELLHKKLNGPLRILSEQDIGRYGIKALDWTKILINISSWPVTVEEVLKVLREAYHIEPELWDQENILFMLGIGSRPDDVKILRHALEDLIKEYLPAAKYRELKPEKNRRKRQQHGEIKDLPPVRLTPREAWKSAKREVKVKDSLGLIAAETISIYPPGIPLIAAGEEITPYVQECLQQPSVYNWLGWAGCRRGTIFVVDI